jgi:hypothetical protein
MDIPTLTSYFSKLGVSWYRSREAGRFGKIEPISKFGVGILSCFAVSEQLLVQTRRDPNTDLSPNGISVEIPRLESHFRIRRTPNLPVGTKITLEISSSAGELVSVAAICEAITRTARFVRHRVRVHSDSLAGADSFLAGAQVFQNSTDADRAITVRGMRGETAETLSSLTSKIAFEVGSMGERYNGYYAAIIPKEPNKTSQGGYNAWVLSGKSIDLSNVLVSSEQALYVKGIKAGRVHPRITNRHSSDSMFGLVRQHRVAQP